MATIREKRPGAWEAPVLTGNDARGRPTQISRTAGRGKRDAQRMAASLEVGPGTPAWSQACASCGSGSNHPGARRSFNRQ